MQQHILARPTTPLSGGGVLLRLPQVPDAAALYTYGQEPDVAQTRWLPLRLGCSHAEARRVIRVFQQGWASPCGLTLVVTVPPSATLCGVIHLTVPEPACGEIGYGIAPAYRGRGVATGAVRLLTAWALAELGFNRLKICVTARSAWPRRPALSRRGYAARSLRRRDVPTPTQCMSSWLGHTRLASAVLPLAIHARNARLCGPPWANLIRSSKCFISGTTRTFCIDMRTNIYAATSAPARRPSRFVRVTRTIVRCTTCAAFTRIVYGLRRAAARTRPEPRRPRLQRIRLTDY